MTRVGAHIGFAGAVYTDRPNLQVLSLPLPLFWHRTDTRLQSIAACHLGALKKALLSLDQYYSQISETRALPPDDQPDPRFPHKIEFTELVTSASIRFKYVSQIPEKLVFFGKTDNGDQICIKFVRSYSVDVHQFFAGMGCAPTLKGFESVPGGWFMVVMDVIGSDYCLFDPSVASIKLYNTIKGKLTILHQNHYIHGDVRDTNIMVKKDSETDFMLFDFDWAGEIGKVQYPMNINIGPDLWRPDGAVDGLAITADHDMAMLDEMFSSVLQV
jgi:serine/threonine protein kinase